MCLATVYLNYTAVYVWIHDLLEHIEEYPKDAIKELPDKEPLQMAGCEGREMVLEGVKQQGTVVQGGV